MVPAPTPATAAPVIRLCTARDLTSILRRLKIEEDGFWHNRKLLRKHILDVWVLHVGRALAGMCVTESDAFTPSILWVPSHRRGLGHGSTLVRHFERVAIAAGQTEMRVTSLPDAVGFWERARYTRDGPCHNNFVKSLPAPPIGTEAPRLCGEAR